MKKILIIFILVSIVFLLCVVFGYNAYIKIIDNEYATKFSQVFENYNINDIDSYFSDSTQFIYKEEKKSYRELRYNIEKACEKKCYEFFVGSSYGYGNDKFNQNFQRVNIKLSGNLHGENFGDCNISMVLEKIGLFSFKIHSVECDEEVFGEFFFSEH